MLYNKAYTSTGLTYSYTSDGKYPYVIAISGGRYAAGTISTTGTVVLEQTITGHFSIKVIKLTSNQTVSLTVATDYDTANILIGIASSSVNPEILKAEWLVNSDPYTYTATASGHKNVYALSLGRYGRGTITTAGTCPLTYIDSNTDMRIVNLQTNQSVTCTPYTGNVNDNCMIVIGL